jgi:hypothetical protein
VEWVHLLAPLRPELAAFAEFIHRLLGGPVAPSA